MMNGFSIPKGLRPPAQGCEERATLGKWNSEIPNPNGVVPPSRAHRSGSKRRNPFGVGNLSARLPRVASPSFVKSTSEGRQPWALRRNPVGIERRNEIYFFVFIALLL